MGGDTHWGGQKGVGVAAWVVAVLLCFGLASSVRIQQNHQGYDERPNSGGRDLLRVETDWANGSFQFFINGGLWLSSGSVYIQHEGRKYTSTDGSLRVKSARNISGYDGGKDLGSYVGSSFEWEAQSGSMKPRMFTNVKQYKKSRVVVFEQVFPDGVSNTATDGKHCNFGLEPNACDWVGLASAFPTFQRTAPSSEDLGWMEIYGQHINGKHGEGPSLGKWSNLSDTMPDGLLSGPLALFNEGGSVAIVSPLSQFMSASMDTSGSVNGSEVSFGLMGGIDAIPQGYSISHVLFAGTDGINHAFEEWGRLLLAYYGKDTAPSSSDVTDKYLTFITDNGAYYYYHAETGKNMLETLLDVDKYGRHLDIPYRNVMIDSWWYYQDANGAVTKWDARDDIFPGGNLGFRELGKRTDWRIIAHNRYWGNETVYDKDSGGAFEFIHDTRSGNDTRPVYALPKHEAFWDYLFGRAVEEWGLYTYEQDWLWVQFLGMDALLTSPTLGREWLIQMGTSAEKLGVNIEYCMVLPRHVLQSVEIPAVDQVRASDDYGPSSRFWQWRLGRSSIFASALALAPSKDGFYTTHVQPGGSQGLFIEASPELQSLVSTMTTGPVLVADGIGYSNKELIMRSCTEDGLVLRPSKAMTAMDFSLIEEAFGRTTVDFPRRSEVWGTYSHVGSDWWFHVLAADLQEPVELKLSDVLRMAPASEPVRHWGDAAMLAYSISPLDFRLQNLRIFKFGPGGDPTMDVVSLPMKGRLNFDLFHYARVYPNGWAILGELSKWVPTSPDRVVSVSWDQTSVAVTVKGSQGEVVRITFANVSGANTVVESRSCQIGPSLRCTVHTCGAAPVKH